MGKISGPILSTLWTEVREILERCRWWWWNCLF